jgi:hypothetical protein
MSEELGSLIKETLSKDADLFNSLHESNKCYPKVILNESEPIHLRIEKFTDVFSSEGENLFKKKFKDEESRMK